MESAAAFLYVASYDGTVSGTEVRLCATQVINLDVRGTGTFVKPVTFASGRTLKLQAARAGGGFTTTRILGGGATHAGYLKLS